MKNIYLFLFTAILFVSCKNDPKTTTEDENINEPVAVEETSTEAEKTPARQLAESISTTHHQEDFFKNEAVAFDITVRFGGQERLKGKVTMLTNSTKIKIEKQDSTTIVYDGNGVFLYPEEKNYSGARFDIFTWPYFFAMPFKLTDNGTKWQEKQERNLGSIDSTEYNSAKLTFEGNIGDAPDDWYVIYASKQTNLLKAAAYIVTFGKDVEKAEENPHAIVYNQYFTVKDVPVAKYWNFYNWSEEKGVYGEPIGDTEISNLKYLSASEVNFEVPENAVEVKK
ncbi:hypothetical protein SAMN04488096_101147 [Mesonia phycicola]|uniref:Heat-shock protein Hsp90 n=1 Tax=Mesonia phycicola TaxID=579105 RepID=A0A1M6A8U6_9FLAO|nr:hypothetical protein [Mesonia phycicola]SHI32954.1 hypothetical protein SAMN04488096_101147 [Mesonia phycicola]